MIRFHALGALDLRDSDGREILSVLAQPKRLALLAYLAASPPGRFHRRDTLLGLFWPDSDKQHARDSLRQAIHHLRCSLGKGVIVGRGDEELGIDAALLWCDAAAFEQALGAGEAERALELYRGNLLAGFFLSEAPDFEQWLERERARLLERAVEVAWILAENLESGDDQVGAARFARRAVELSPNDEGTLRRLMSLLARLGDRASAVRAYEAFAARLAEACGVQPSTETRALAEEVRGSEMAVTYLPTRAQRTTPFTLAGHSEHASGARPAPQNTDGTGHATRQRRPTLRGRSRLAGLALAGLLLLAGAGIMAWAVRVNPMAADQVLILPFQNRTGDPSLDPLGRWATDWVMQDLTRTNRIQVVDASVGLPGSRAGAPAGALLLRLLEWTGAGTVINGAYYRYGDSIQFQVQISDANSGTLVPMVEPVSGSLEQPQFAVRTLSQRITGAVAAHLDPRSQAFNSDGSRPPSYEAYQAWIEGVEQYTQRNFRDARENLLHASSLDSTFVTPLIWAAGAGIHLGEHEWTDSLLGVANARRDRLLPFDRHFLDMKRADLVGDRAADYRAGRRLLEVAPASELALYLFGAAALGFNRPAEAVDALRRIDTEQSAVDWDLYGTRLTAALHLAGDYPGELAEAQRVRAHRPGLLRAIGDEARALAALGRTEEVLYLLDRALMLSAQPGATPAGIARDAAEELAAHGHAEAAGEALARALAWYRTHTLPPPGTEAQRYDLARVLYRTGRWDEAEQLFRELSKHAPERVDYIGYLGVVAMRRGLVREADRISARLSRLDNPYLSGANTLWRARIAAVAGRQDEAIELLRAAFAEGQGYWLLLHSDPDLASLRDEPAFRRLLQPRR